MDGQSTTLKGSAKESGAEITLDEVRNRKPIDYPIYPHACGSWVKKINGQRWTFGGWRTDPEGKRALQEFYRQKDHIEKYGERPPENLTPEEAEEAVLESQLKGPGLTIDGLMFQYIAELNGYVESGRRSAKHYHEMKRHADKLTEFFGGETKVVELQPADFKRLRKSWEDDGLKPKTLEGYVTRTKIIFNWAYEEELIDQPIRFKKSFRKPGSVEINRERNKERAENGGKFFEAEELRLMLDALAGQQITLKQKGKKRVKVTLEARPDLRAMVLLGINCGLGNEDLSGVTEVYINLETGWLDYPRGKTAEQRRSKLWPETVAAIREAIAFRSDPKFAEDEDKFFLTPRGLPIVRVNSKGTPIDGLGSPFVDILKQIGLYRKGRGFYALRHTFENIGSSSGLESAVSLAMGHAASGISRNYREYQAEIWNEKLETVAAHIHAWLWPDAE